MIVDSDTVIQPGAMMVESFHTSVTDGAVTRSGGPQDEAVGTHLAGMDLLEQLKEVVR
jgi:hypothetical protein